MVYAIHCHCLASLLNNQQFEREYFSEFVHFVLFFCVFLCIYLVCRCDAAILAGDSVILASWKQVIFQRKLLQHFVHCVGVYQIIIQLSTNRNLLIVPAYGKWGYYLLSLLQFMYPFLGKEH